MSEDDDKRLAAQAMNSLLDNPQVYDLMVNKISSEVEARVAKRAAQRRNFIIAIFGSIAAALVAATGIYHTAVVNQSVRVAVDAAVAQRVNAEVGVTLGVEVDNAVDAAVEESFGDLRQQIEVASLSLEATDLINTVHENDSFSEEQKNAAVSLLERAVNYPAFTQRPVFLIQLERLIDALAASGVGSDIDNLETIYREQMSRSVGIAVTLTDHYGRQLLSSPGAPTDWDDSIREGYFSRYQRYSDVVRRGGYPEVYVFYQMLIEYLRADAGDDSVVLALIREVDSLNDVDTDAFWRLVSAYARDEISVSPTPETTRMSNIVRGFLMKYQGENQGFATVLSEL